MELLLTPSAWISLLFDETAKSPLSEILDRDQIEDLDPGDVLCCALCMNRITTRSAAISMGGSHGHTFTNPGGYTFHIGCFSRVWNCTSVGGASTENTWFAGYAWRIVGCASCGEHLGWRYSRDGDSFHGLILGKLVAGDSRAG